MRSPNRRLGSLDGAALVIANVVGVGIFTTPGIIAGMVTGPSIFLALWVLGGALAMCGALVYAELGATYPEVGGEYVYIRKAFGPMAGFLSGWTSFMAGFSGAIAASAVAFGAYLDRLIPGSGSTAPIVEVSVLIATISVTPRGLTAVSLIALLTAVHLRGLGAGRAVQNTLAILSAVTILAVVIVGLVAEGPRHEPFANPAGAPLGGATPLLALVLIMFTYSGWNAPTYLAGEMRAPRRNLRLAAVIGTGTVVLLYLGLNVVYLKAVPFAELAGELAIADLAVASLLGDAAGQTVTVLALLALASAVGAMIMTGPRVYFAMARDRCFPAAFARSRPRARIPTAAVLAQGLWSALLAATGSFQQLVTYTGFAVVLFGGLAVASLFVLRRRPGENARPRRVWGYPFTPAVFLLASGAIILEVFRSAPLLSLAGLGIIAAGIPIYFWSSKQAHNREV